MDKENSPVSIHNPIDFKPLSEGLGFHPFSDGFPYAPSVRNAKLSKSVNSSAPQANLGPPLSQGNGVSIGNGSGAIGAGASHFIPASKNSIPLGTQATSKESELENEKFNYKYTFQRIVAQLIDCSSSILLFYGLIQIGFWTGDLSTELMANPGVILLVACFWLSFHWFIVVFQEILFKTSLGKKFFGLCLNGSSLLILVRALVFIPSISLGGIGLIWSLIDAKKRCWHDRISGIQPTTSVYP